MRIAYVTAYDASDMRQWSGLGHFIARALQHAGGDLVFVRSPTGGRHFGALARRVAYRAAGANFLWNRDLALLKMQARRLQHDLSRIDCDVVFSPGTLPIAFLEDDRPIAFWTDATFTQMCDFYPEFTNVSAASRSAGTAADSAALARTRLALYASDWAATAARRQCDQPGKIKVVPFGANLFEQPTLETVLKSVRSRRPDSCELLFVGLEWARKGGDVAVAVTRELNQRGIRSRLTVVGCRPPIAPEDARFVTVAGFVGKESPDGRSKLKLLFEQSHFLLLPSRAECYGLVLCEASAYGVPSLASGIGGIPTVVRTGVNGCLFSLDDVTGYADYIQRVLRDWDGYERLALSSHREYQQRLNWEVNGRLAVMHLDALK